MKQFWKEFFLRGAVCAAGGPVVLAIIYGILGATGTVEQLPAGEVCLATLSITLLAFIAAGMTAIYQTEQLPLPIAILTHGGVLYLAYIVTYLINGWLQKGLIPVLVFSAIFIAGYVLIWLIIYCISKANTEKVNKILSKR